MRTSYDTAKAYHDKKHAFLSKLLNSNRQLATAKGPKPYADILSQQFRLFHRGHEDTFAPCLGLHRSIGSRPTYSIVVTLATPQQKRAQLIV
jgi:hypothetical protein